jgi:hypothetical protein
LIAGLCTWLLPSVAFRPWAAGSSVWPALTAFANTAIAPSFPGLVCLYAVFAISSHLDLSREDMKVAISGFAPLFVVLLCANLLASLVHADLHAYIREYGARALTAWAWILGFTAIASALHLLLAFSLTSLVHALMRREPIKPFNDSYR